MLMNLEEKGYIDSMRVDGIEPVDYREVDNVLLDIKRDLESDPTPLFS